MRSISLLSGSFIKSLIVLCCLSLAAVSSYAQDAAAGKAVFTQKCAACHAFDKKLVGPALKELLRNIRWTGS